MHGYKMWSGGCFYLKLKRSSWILKLKLLPEVQISQSAHYHIIFGENINGCTRKKPSKALQVGHDTRTNTSISIERAFLNTLFNRN